MSPSTSQSSIATTPPTARHSWPTCRAPECAFNGQVFAVYGGYVGLYGGYSIADEIREDRQLDIGELTKLLGDDAFLKSVETRRAGIPKIEGETK